MIKVKRKIFIKQDGFKNCGMTCLLMIIQYYGGYIPKTILEEKTKTTRSGTNAYNLIEAAKELGFEAYGMNYKLDMKTPFLPAIFHVVIDNYNHFVVIYEINKEKKYLIVADPASKIKKMSFDEFNKIFTGKILIFYPIRKIVKYQKPKVIPYIKKMIINKKFLICFILSFLTIIISLCFLIFLKQLLNLNKNMLLPILFLVIIKYIVNMIKDHYIISYNKKINSDCNINIYQNILSLPYAFYRNHTTGETISRIQDMDNINSIVGISLLIITDFLIMIFTGIMLYAINKVLFLVSFIISLIYVINYFVYNKKLIIAIEEFKLKKSLYTSYITESIVGFESIKGQNLTDHFIEKFKIKNADYLKSTVNYEKIKANISNQLNLINDIIPITLLTLGSVLISKNLLTLETLVLFYIILTYFLNPIQNLIETSMIFKDIKISLEHILELSVKQKQIPRTSIGNIELNDISFEKNDQKILNKITFKINLKDKIMFIGKSGSGKSTILKLLKQYYQANNILVDKENINNLDFGSKVTYISQNEFLFTDTIMNNITMGKDISEKKLKKVIKICELENIIKRDPLGLNSLIEENGFNFSGGEKQRIILARSLINIQDYLFIDEGLGEMDKNLERRIIKNLFKYYKDKTIIIVSHRLDNIDLFNKVIKLEDDIEVIEKKKGGI